MLIRLKGTRIIGAVRPARDQLFLRTNASDGLTPKIKMARLSKTEKREPYNEVLLVLRLAARLCAEFAIGCLGVMTTQAS